MKRNHAITMVAALMLLSGVFMSFKAASTDEPAKMEFTSLTVVESIIPSGIGRSRIIQALEGRDYTEYTKVMTADDKGRNKAKRGDIRVKNYEETKLLNLYNMGGIRFQNIAANDAVLKSRVNAMLADGWEIISINSAVEAYAGKDDTDGIFLTRYYFKRAKK